MKTLIKNAKIILQHEILEGSLIIESGSIVELHNGTAPLPYAADRIIDAQGKYLSPGFVEVHTHGAGGHDFMDGTPEAFAEASKAHMQHGTTALLPTTLSASPEDTAHCVDCFMEAKKNLVQGPHLLGLHMEGPYLNPAYKGAMQSHFLRKPEPREYMALLERADGQIARWTVAPELNGALEMGDRLKSYGVLMSVGHSAATYREVMEAYQHGYSHVTHLFSAMSSITRIDGFRHSGVLESALIMDGLTVEMIADGCHLPVELLDFTYRIKGAGSTCLVCDSMRGAGTDETRSYLGGLHTGFEVVIEDHVAKLPDKSGFAGSVATDDRLVRVMHKQVGIDLTECIQMMSLTPAKIIGVDRQKGSIAVGKDADLVLFDDDIKISWVMVSGEITYTA